MEIRPESCQQRENALTVVRGCVGTVLHHWSRLDDAMKKTLLETALAKTVILVRNLEDELRTQRISTPDTGTEGMRI